jgi:hypothetical protein
VTSASQKSNDPRCCLASPFHDQRHCELSRRLAEPVRALLDPQRRREHFISARLVQLAGTRAGGVVLTRQEAAGKWGATTYALVRTAKAAQRTGA